MSEQLNELFDKYIEAFGYPVINMNPKYKVPQVWQFGVPGTNSLMARLMQFTGKETVKQYKRGDAIAEVFLLSGTSHGHAVPLKGGLGEKPLDAINLIFVTVWESIKLGKPDVVLFRFPSKKMKGQDQAVIRIMNRLIQMKTSGRYHVLPNASGLGKKNAYVIMYKKGVDLLSVDGMPPVPEKYQKVETKVGDVFTNKDTGAQVSKQEIAAEVLIDAANKKTDAAVAQKTKISRRAIAQAQYAPSDSVPDGWDEIDAEAAKFSRPATAELIDDYEELEIFVRPSETNTMARMRAADAAMRANGVWKEEIRVEDSDPIFNRMHRELKRAPVGSMKQMQIFAESCAEILNLRKAAFIERKMNDAPPNLDAATYAASLWEKEYTSAIRVAVKDFAEEASENTLNFTAGYTDNRFHYGQREAIADYCGANYADINNYLMGKYYEEEAEFLNLDRVVETIKELDSAFEIGHKLPPNTTLWRGQYLNVPTFDKIKKSKLFYFRNYVSTSFKPIIFGGWVANVAMAAVHQDYRDGTSFQADDEIVLPDMPDARRDHVMMHVGWKISGADLINVIVPGELSGNPSEQEVILPRGTVVKITKITDASYQGNANVKMLEADIQTTDQLDENAVIYDGDVLMETGELVVYQGKETEEPAESVDFASFASSGVTKKVNQGLGILASCINLEAIPPKFLS